MALTRRGVLAGAAALAAARPRAGAAGVPDLRAAEAEIQLAPPEHPKTAIWGYDGIAPGPVIRARRGERLARRLVNALPEPTTIHWHGIRIDNAMDGVPGLTQEAVAPGGTFLYDFTLPDAGTYWYHSHQRGWEQVARGLAGPLIVDEEAPPEVDRDEVLVLDDWRLDPRAQIEESFGALRDWSHAGRIGNFITVNGSATHRLAVRRHERLRLRLINAANARIFTVGLKGLAGWVVALDGMPLARPEPAGEFRLAPAQRADLIVDVTAEADEAFVVSLEDDGGYALTTFAVDAPAGAARPGPPPPLPPNAVAAIADLDRAERVELVMAGGAMGGMASARLDGIETDIRTLARKGKVWAFNGIVAPAPEPLAVVRRGQTVRIAMTNDTRWPHAMHLHGHHFRQLGADGPGPLRDTILMDARAQAEIAFVADNPGLWLFHCHMLEHAAAGMTAWIEVT